MQVNNNEIGIAESVRRLLAGIPTRWALSELPLHFIIEIIEGDEVGQCVEKMMACPGMLVLNRAIKIAARFGELLRFEHVKAAALSVRNFHLTAGAPPVWWWERPDADTRFARRADAPPSFTWRTGKPVPLEAKENLAGYVWTVLYQATRGGEPLVVDGIELTYDELWNAAAKG